MKTMTGQEILKTMAGLSPDLFAIAISIWDLQAIKAFYQQWPLLKASKASKATNLLNHEIQKLDENMNSPQAWAVLIQKECYVTVTPDQRTANMYRTLANTRQLKNVITKMCNIAKTVGMPVDDNMTYLKAWCGLGIIEQSQSTVTEQYRLLRARLATFKGKDGITALTLASYYGDIDIVKELIKAGADVNAGGPASPSPLIRAAINEHTDVMELLLKNGAKIEEKRLDKNHGTCSALMLMVKRFPTIGISTGQGGNSDRFYKVIAFLLEKGADPNTTDGRNSTPLVYIGEKQWPIAVSLIELLMKYQAKVDHLDSDGRSALSYAAERGQSELVDSLVKHGAKTTYEIVFRLAGMGSIRIGGMIDDSIKYGEIIIGGMIDDRMIDDSIKYGKTMESLLKGGFDLNEINEKDFSKKTLLMKCLHGNKTVFVESFLKHGAKVDAVDADGLTALMHYMGKTYSHHMGVPDYIPLFVDTHKANMNIQDKKGRTALMHAYIEKKNDLAKKLIDRHANLDLRDERGKTALMYAINPPSSPNEVFGYSIYVDPVPAVRALVDNGSNTLLKDKSGHTALMEVRHIRMSSTSVCQQVYQLIFYAMLRQAQLSDLNWIHAECAAVNHDLNALIQGSRASQYLHLTHDFVETVLSASAMVEFITQRVADMQSIQDKVKILEEATLTVNGRPGNALSTFLHKKSFTQLVTVRESPVEPLKRMLAELKAGMGNGAGPSSVRINTNNI